MAQEKDRQAPIITKIVDSDEKSRSKDFGGALGIPGNQTRKPTIVSIGIKGFKV